MVFVRLWRCEVLFRDAHGSPLVTSAEIGEAKRRLAGELDLGQEVEHESLLEGFAALEFRFVAARDVHVSDDPGPFGSGKEVELSAHFLQRAFGTHELLYTFHGESRVKESNAMRNRRVSIRLCPSSVVAAWKLKLAKVVARVNGQTLAHVETKTTTVRSPNQICRTSAARLIPVTRQWDKVPERTAEQNHVNPQEPLPSVPK